MSTAIEAGCACGARFQAKIELAGKRVKCPKCGQAMQIPLATASDDPLGISGAASDPLGLNTGSGLFGGQPAAVQPIAYPGPIPSAFPNGNPGAFPGAYPSMPGGPTVAQPAWNAYPAAAAARPNASSQRTSASSSDRRTGSLSQQELATGILAAIHGASVLYGVFSSIRFILLLAGNTRAGSEVLTRMLFSPGMLLVYVGVLASGGVLAGGIGILMKKEWGLGVGSVSAYAYFALVALGLLMSIPSLLSLGGITGLLFYRVPRLVVEGLGPGMILYLHSQKGDNS